MKGTPEQRFWKRVQKTDTCWLWTGSKTKDGYGQISVEGKNNLAHRFSWIFHNGPIPDALCVLHICDNPPCTNPEHLFLGTQPDNMADKTRKGRGNQLKGINHPRIKLANITNDKVKSMFQDRPKKKMTLQAIADKYKISVSYAWCILTGKRNHLLLP